MEDRRHRRGDGAGRGRRPRRPTAILAVPTTPRSSGLTAVGATRLFRADDGSDRQELSTDPAALHGASTSLVADINSATTIDDPGVIDPSDIRELTELQRRAHVLGERRLATGGQELWRSNGGPLGAGRTERSRTSTPAPASGTGRAGRLGADGADRRRHAVFKPATASSRTGDELLEEHGTAANADMIEVNSGTGESSPGCFANIGGVLYFVRVHHRPQGWSCGRAMATPLGRGRSRVEDINANSGGAASSSPCLFTALGSNFFFRANDGFRSARSSGRATAPLPDRPVRRHPSRPASSPAGTRSEHAGRHPSSSPAADGVAGS